MRDLCCFISLYLRGITAVQNLRYATVLFKFVFFREQSLSACAAIRKITEEAESCSSERNEVRGEQQKSRADPVAENHTQGAAVFVGNSQPMWLIINCSIFIMRSQLYQP